ncbi:MAG: transcriptional regulator [Desulfosarcina sp.]|nr:transcriptional regulator [Desulfobacterales bacterium]
MTNGTLRQQMVALLREGDRDVRGLSQRLRISEKDVIAHLPHVQQSLAAGGERLVIRPAFCWACGFTFVGRGRFTRPGRCPQCRQTRIEPPVFQVV